MEKIKKHGQRDHNKASERYIDVTFTYEDGEIWEGSIPIVDRRSGIELTADTEIDEYLEKAYEYCRPQNRQVWLDEQELFWGNKTKAVVTKPFFDALKIFDWCCGRCQLPTNPNRQRRIQDLKDSGYTVVTDTHKYCSSCQQKGTHHLLIPFPRGGISGYEMWSPTMRKRIVSVLKGVDVFEGKTGRKEGLLPDHKFPEIRWDENTKRPSLESLTNEEIKKDFQLLSNQRNQQKREVCRNCYQTNKRGYPFGIKFFYEGNENWPETVPDRGKEAEHGCVGCGWYDMAKWRESLNRRLAEHSEPADG